MAAPEPGGLGERIARLAKVSLTDEAIDAFLRRVADLTVEVVPACDASSVSMARDGKVSTWAASHEVAQRLDDVQYGTRQGPCLEAIETSQTVRAGPLTGEERWPKFTPLAVENGIVGICSLPLKVGERTVGAFNLYSLSRTFGDGERNLAEDLATEAAVVVGNAGAYYQARALAQHLDEALQSRDVIGQAKGIIMERERVTADEAFDILRRVSQEKNRKLREVAEMVVLTGAWSDARD